MTLRFQWFNHEIKSKTIKVPYGWKKPDKPLAELRLEVSDEDYVAGNLGHFVVDYEMVPFIEQALNSVNNGTSLRDAANWLTVATGKPISHVGVKTLWEKVVVNPEQTDRQARLDTWHKPKTREEKKQRKLVERRMKAKRAITLGKRTLDKLEQKEIPNDDSLGSNNTGALYSDVPVEAEVLFKPNPGPQTAFLKANELEVLYGGAAGGGKSYAVLADPVRYFYHPDFNGLIIRRTNDELRELIRESKKLYPRAIEGAKFNSQQSTWTFPSGAQLWMSYLENDDDVLRYQGQAFTWIAVDELTQYPTPFAWNYLRSRLRTSAKDLPLYMRATTNPGGPGHSWVKKMFVDPAPPGTAFPARSLEDDLPMLWPEVPPDHKNYDKVGQPLFYRKFIPAKLADNPYLADDGQYEASLLSLPEHQRRQLLDGDWTIAQGAAFPEFQTRLHVIEPFDIPHEWRKFRACDFGYSSHSAVLWFAVDPVWDRLIVYRELYVSKFTGKDLARKIVQIETEGGDQVSYGVLDSSVFHQRGNSGPVISEEMAAEGVRFRPSDRGHGSRIAGRNRLHELLKLHDVGDGEQMPGIVFFNTCRQTIADLQVIPTDPKGGEDIDARYTSDHTYDALRYGIMSRPKPNTFYESFTRPSYTNRVADSVFGY